MQEFKGDNSATKMMPDKNDGGNMNTGKEKVKQLFKERLKLGKGSAE